MANIDETLYITTMQSFTEMGNITGHITAEDIQLGLYDVLVPILGSSIILLNLAVVISSGLILQTKVQPRSTYLFLGNVALSDLLSGIAVLFGQFYPREHRDEQFCAIQMGMIVSAIITSVYSIGLISVDRYLYIVYGLQYQRYIYPMRARIMIISTWILGLIIGFLPAMGWIGDTRNGRVCWFVTVVPSELILLTTFTGFLPLLVTLVLYGIILYHALQKIVQLKKAAARHSGHQTGTLRLFVGGRSERNLTVAGSDDEQQSSCCGCRKRFLNCCRRTPAAANQDISSTGGTSTTTGRTPSKWTAIKVVLLTTGCFVVTWVPFLIAATWFVFCDNKTTPELCKNLSYAIASPLSILGFTNGLWNPIIYAWWHNGFRESIKKIYRKLCGCQPEGTWKPPTSPGGTTSTATTNTYVTNQSDTEIMDSDCGSSGASSCGESGSVRRADGWPNMATAEVAAITAIPLESSKRFTRNRSDNNSVPHIQDL